MGFHCALMFACRFIAFGSSIFFFPQSAVHKLFLALYCVYFNPIEKNTISQLVFPPTGLNSSCWISLLLLPPPPLLSLLLNFMVWPVKCWGRGCRVLVCLMHPSEVGRLELWYRFHALGRWICFDSFVSCSSYITFVNVHCGWWWCVWFEYGTTFEYLQPSLIRL
jgi:hypothetical protein